MAQAPTETDIAAADETLADSVVLGDAVFYAMAGVDANGRCTLSGDTDKILIIAYAGPYENADGDQTCGALI